MKVKVRYHGLSREVGIEEEVIELEGSNYAALKAILDKRHRPLTYTPVLYLKDGTPMFPETELKDGDEVSLVRQIGGG
jgi:molybdopterin converting factor small subunit